VPIVDSRQNYQHAQWATENNPVTKSQLEKIVARITRTKDTSNQKNVLVINDSEVNIQLLHIQLYERALVRSKFHWQKEIDSR